MAGRRKPKVRNRAVAERLMAKGYPKTAAVQISNGVLANGDRKGRHRSGKSYRRLR